MTTKHFSFGINEILPRDIVNHILLFLTERAEFILSASQVCRLWKLLCEQEIIWKETYLKMWIRFSPELPSINISWKELFKYRLLIEKKLLTFLMDEEDCENPVSKNLGEWANFLHSEVLRIEEKKFDDKYKEERDLEEQRLKTIAELASLTQTTEKTTAEEGEDEEEEDEEEDAIQGEDYLLVKDFLSSYSPEILFTISYELFEEALADGMEEFNNLNKKKVLSEQETKTTISELKNLVGKLFVQYGRALFRRAELLQDGAFQILQRAEKQFEQCSKYLADNIYNYVDWGDTLIEMAKVKFVSGREIPFSSNLDLLNEKLKKNDRMEEAKKLISQALSKYEIAFKIDPCDSICLCNWAGAFFDLGEIYQSFGSEIEAQEFYSKACEKYELAYANRSNRSFFSENTLLNDWGRALYERSKIKEESESIEFLFKSSEKYEKAYREMESPSSSRALILKNWGDTLCELSSTQKNWKSVDHYYNLAVEKYSQSLKESDDKSTVLNNWGSANNDQAKMKQSKNEVIHYLKLAAEKYQQGLIIKPDDDTILFNLGDVLAEQSRITTSKEECEALFELAIETYSKSSTDSITLNNWGFALYEHATLKEGKEKEILLQESHKKYHEALVLDNRYYTSICNIGNIYRERAFLVQGEETYSYFRKAIQQFEESLQYNKNHFKAYTYWAQTLLEWSQILTQRHEDPSLARAKLLEAKERISQALKIKSNFYLAYFTLADICAYLGYEGEYENLIETCRNLTGFTDDPFRYRVLSVRPKFSLISERFPLNSKTK